MITDAELTALGSGIGLEPSLLKAVILVECGSLSGNLDSGKPKILFEGHIFYKLVKKKYGEDRALEWARLYPEICYKSFTRNHYLGGEDEYTRYWLAKDLDKDLASQSCSWGLGQIMGFNYGACGCSTVDEFVSKNWESEEDQLELWLTYLTSNNLVKLLQEKDWKAFARAYNGSAQVDYYAEKLEKTYLSL